MAAPTTKMTVAEYELVEPAPDGWWDLHHGGLVKMRRPQIIHTKTQMRLVNLLGGRAGHSWVVIKDLPFRPAAEYEVWSADVAVLSRDRWDSAGDGWLMGAPELVIEVVSSSNTMTDVLDRERTCMTGGCSEFWVADPVSRLVKVQRVDGTSGTYGDGDFIPLGVSSLPVTDIFSD